MKKIVLVLLALAAAAPLFARGNEQSVEAKPVIEVFLSPYIREPQTPSYNPYKDYIDKLTNADWRLSLVSSDFASELSTRVVANDIPDLIVFNDNPILFNMYGQGVLLDDWNVYKDRMPRSWDNMGEVQRNYYTVDGKLILMGVLPGGQAWAWNIRKDWLSRLGLKMPTTPEELLEVAKAFTFNDPDGNGQNDTYGFTSAGGQGIGEISNLLTMYGPDTFYIKDNKVTHPVLDGNYKKFLDFMRQIVDARVIDPDWYNLEWESRKPSMANGKYGIIWYPADNLLAEIDNIRNYDGVVADWYTYLPTPRGTPEGGKLGPSSIFGHAKRTASARAGRDKAKMDAIVTLLEHTAPGNPGYWDIDFNMWHYFQKGTMKNINGIEYVYYSPEEMQEIQNHPIPGGNANWGVIFTTDPGNYIRISGTTPEPGRVELERLLQTAQNKAAARYDTSYSQFLVLDQTNTASANSVNDEFSIQYILNQTNDYDGFQRRWLSSGGQALIDQATEQYRRYGYIK
jgi:ABC-type glycerol-3-phosphate transport system substrate-binding protein